MTGNQFGMKKKRNLQTQQRYLRANEYKRRALGTRGSDGDERLVWPLPARLGRARACWELDTSKLSPRDPLSEVLVQTLPPLRPGSEQLPTASRRDFLEH